jgi:hypothetical protein
MISQVRFSKAYYNISTPELKKAWQPRIEDEVEGPAKRAGYHLYFRELDGGKVGVMCQDAGMIKPAEKPEIFGREQISEAIDWIKKTLKIS